MKTDRIDVIKSKHKGKLVRKSWLIEIRLRILETIIFAGIIPFIGYMWGRDQIIIYDNFYLGALILITTFSIGFTLVFSSYKTDRLLRVKGVSREKNRALIKEIALNKNWQIQAHNNQYSIFNLPFHYLTLDFGRQLVVLYEKDEIWINATTFLRFDSKSPFHWFANRKAEKIIINAIKNQTV